MTREHDLTGREGGAAGYQAALVDPATEREALIRLWASNLRMDSDPGATLRWQYLEAPNAPAHAFLLRAPGAGEPAVGCAGITTRELWSDGRALRAAHFANFAIDREHRTALPAILLQRAVRRHVEAGFDVGLGFPNRSAIAVYRRVGYHEFGELPRYARVLRHGGYLERKLHERVHLPGVREAAGLAARVAGALVDTAVRARDSARAARAARRFTIRWLADTDARFDQLWSTARATFGIASRRDAAFLRWRFLRKPDERHEIAALVDRASDELRAYAIVAGSPGGLGEVHDAFGTLTALDALFALLVPALYHRGHTGITFEFLGDPRVVALLARHRFVRRDASRTAVVIASPGCVAPALHDPTAWYLTGLDVDA